MKIAVHITHESVKKIGGIGSVLSGVCNSQTYKEVYDRTVFYGPLFDIPTDSFSHLGKSGELLYSSHDNFDANNYTEVFGEIAKKYNVNIIYGRRQLVSEFDRTKHAVVEVINVGIHKMDHKRIEDFKHILWENFDIKSHLYEDDWDYQQYVRIGAPYLEILDKLYGSDDEYYHFSHEYMGVPSTLAVLAAERKDKTIFIGHEVTTARSIVESHYGHDISFYNILQKAPKNKSLEQIFGSQEHNPRSELVKRAVNFDHIFAVGDLVKDEYKFLVPQTPDDKIKIVYNGVSAKSVGLEEKEQSRAHIEQYTERLFNFKPDAIFTHVTRLVISKGIWRDIALLGHLDDIFVEKGLKGVYILLSTLVGTGREPEDVLKMERDYGWPVLHSQGWPDLIGTEKDTYSQIQIFNAKSKAIKALFINQFGFDKTRCGKRVPEDAEFNDLRLASDAELGLSIYEPFGIAQIETIPFGGISILSSSCGAAGLLVKNFKDAPIKPFYIVDYIASGKKLGYESLKSMAIEKRDALESEFLAKHVKEIFDILPLTSKMREQYLLNAQEHAAGISWDASAGDYVFNFSPST